MSEKVSKKTGRGGARPGAGRPRGSGNKCTAQDLTDAIQRETGQPFVECLAQGYHQSIQERNNSVRVAYEKMILDKIMADRHQVEVEDTTDTVQARRASFAAALATVVAAAPAK